MTLSLWALPVAILLPYLWSVATIPARRQLPGGLDNAQPRSQQVQLTGAAARAMAAHANAFEALPAFVAGVLTAHVTEADPTLAAALSWAWVALRVGHGAAYLADLHPVRSTCFSLALGCSLGLFAIAAL